MATETTVDLRPGIVNFLVYGTGTWTEEFTIAALGDLTGATITAKHRAKGSDTSTTLTVDPTDPTNSTFRVTNMPRTVGSYDIEITLPGGVARTYVAGSIKVTTDRA